MGAEKLLKDIRFVDNRINSKIRQLDQLRSQIGTVKSFDYTKDRVQESNQPGSTIEDLVTKICDLEREVAREIDCLVDKKNVAIREINTLAGPEGMVLEMRYLENMAWRDIAYTLGLSNQHVYSLHKKAIKNLEKNKNQSKSE